MKTIFCFVIMATLFPVSFAFAGDISSGGIGQILEDCSSIGGDIRLKVQVVDNSYLEATLENYTDLLAINISKYEVSITDEGYKSDEIVIIKTARTATVVVSGENLLDEPQVFANLVCESNFN